MRGVIRRDWRLILVIFLAALAVRLIYMGTMTDSPVFDAPMMDAQVHMDWAWDIAQLTFLGNPAPYFRAPLYPYFLSPFFTDLSIGLWGGDADRAFFYGARLLQFFMGALSCVMVYLLARLLRNRTAGLIAALMATFYWVFIFFEGEFVMPVLIVFLNLLGFLFLWQAMGDGRLRTFLAAGVLFGLSTITRPNILVFFPFLLLWIVFAQARETRRRAVRQALVLAAGIVVCIAPVTARNYFHGHDLVLISSQAGVNFYIGNNPQSDGITAVVPGTSSDWWGGYHQTIQIASEDSGRPLKASEVSRYWFKRGLRYLAEEPGDALDLYWVKLRLLFDTTEISNNIDIHYFRNISGFLGLPIFVSTAVVFPLGLAGMIFGRRDRFWLLLTAFVVLYMLSFVPFFITTRYRVPASPFLMVLAGLWLESLRGLWRADRQGRAILQAGGCVTLFLIFMVTASPLPPNADPSQPSQGMYTAGLAHYRKGEFAEAVPLLERTRVVPWIRVGSLLFLGDIYLKQGRDDLAVQRFGEALALDPNTRAEVGQMLESTGRTDLKERLGFP